MIVSCHFVQTSKRMTPHSKFIFPIFFFFPLPRQVTICCAPIFHKPIKKNLKIQISLPTYTWLHIPLKKKSFKNIFQFKPLAKKFFQKRFLYTPIPYIQYIHTSTPCACTVIIGRVFFVCRTPPDSISYPLSRDPIIMR